MQADPNGHLDLWSRGHYKSSIITFALSIQDILNDPEVTIGLFSHTRPIAKAFLRQIKREFEVNAQLKAWFPDILYQDPHKESPKWSEDEGIVVKRQSNPKEATVEAWGLVDGQPTSKHYRRMVYDDTVTRESVTTPEQVQKTTEAWELSRNLAATHSESRYIGTRYAFADTYKVMMDRGVVKPRVYAATKDGMMEGEPWFLSRDALAEKRKNMGPYTFSTQMMQNPKADDTQGFDVQWVRTASLDQFRQTDFNIYMLVDAASEKKKDSDYTCIWVWGIGQDGNYYTLDIVRDRLNLTERAKAVMSLHRKWKPLQVGYERYGMMADIEYLKIVQTQEHYRFDVIEVGGQVPKRDRIRRLIPIMEQGKVYMPPVMFKRNYEGVMVDLIRTFKEEELQAFPFGTHDDMLDAASRLFDIDAKVPAIPDSYQDQEYEVENPHSGRSAVGGY